MNKYPVADVAEHSAEMHRSLKMAMPYHSRGELMTLALMGQGLPSTMSMYHLKNDRGGRALKLTSALRGMNDEPPVTSSLHPKTNHRPAIYQHTFSGGSAPSASFPLIKPGGGRSANRKASQMTRTYKGDAGIATLGAQQYYQRANGYRSITDRFDPINIQQDSWLPQPSATEWAGAYIESGGHYPTQHDDLVHRELTENATTLYWHAVQPLGLHDGYVPRQNFLV